MKSRLNASQAISTNRRATTGQQEKKVPTRPVARIDEDLCTGCEVCHDFCPAGCIETVPGTQFERIGAVCRIEKAACVGCFICAEYCRWEAIEALDPGKPPASS